MDDKELKIEMYEDQHEKDIETIKKMDLQIRSLVGNYNILKIECEDLQKQVIYFNRFLKYNTKSNLKGAYEELRKQIEMETVYSCRSRDDVVLYILGLLKEIENKE